MSCSARVLRSSGRSGGWSSASSSPSTRNVGGRPTLRCRSDPLRRIISWSTPLKFRPAAGAPADAGGGAAAGTGFAESGGVGLAIRIDLEQHLAVLHRLGVLRQDLTNHAGVLGLDLVHDLHRLDDADDL